MAKILTPYVLTPLVDHKNFLGVSDDALSDCVIVTLSKNIIRFRLSGKNVLSSWNSKQKLTAPVVYDYFNNRFIGVYNCDVVTSWQDSLEQFYKPKKYKFTYLVHSVVSSKEVPPHVVYMNGSIMPLIVDREFRKEPAEDYISTNENIEEVKLVSILGNKYVSLCTISKNSNERTLYFTPISDGKEKVTIKLFQKDTSIKIICYTIIESEVSSQLITLWSNGNLNSLELPTEENELPGRLVGNINFISLSENASLFPVSSSQVAIYGAQPDGEGAVVAIYSIKFGVVEASEKLKVFNNIGKSHTRSRELILPSGADLLVIPYKLHTTRLAGLIGSQSQTVAGNFDDLRKQGIAESRICETLIPEVIESKNVEGLLKILESCNDIPDEPLLKALGFALQVDQNETSEAIIQSVLRKQLVGDFTSLRAIRQHIPLSSALILLKRLSEEISTNSGDKIPIDWACILLDAHYQQYLLLNNSDVLNAMKEISDTIAEQLNYMEELKELNWEIRRYLRGSNQMKKLTLSSRNYGIETIQLY